MEGYSSRNLFEQVDGVVGCPTSSARSPALRLTSKAVEVHLPLGNSTSGRENQGLEGVCAYPPRVPDTPTSAYVSTSSSLIGSDRLETQE